MVKIIIIELYTFSKREKLKIRKEFNSFEIVTNRERNG
jgi:hypothetical protein